MSTQRGDPVGEEVRTAFRRDGFVPLRGLFGDWVEVLRAGVEENLAQPGPFAAERGGADDTGRFFEDYCNWERIGAYGEFVRRSRAAETAGRLMGARRVQFFHEHLLVKEPGTSRPTPWHQDLPYYCVDGSQTVSLWLALDPVPEEVGVRFVPGSHRWEAPIEPRRWLDDLPFYGAGGEFAPLPDIDAEPERYAPVSFALEPGDALAFDFRTLHGAPPNPTTSRRRGLSTRWLGDDVRFRRRSGRTSPPFPGLDLEDGAPLPEPRFPILWRETATP